MKKFLTYSVVIATIIWSLGLGALVPLAAQAAYTPVAGDIIKAGTNPAVYYIGSDLKKQLFSNRVTYGSWFNDFTGLKNIATADLPTDSGANVTVRPGTSLVKFDNSGAVYAVTPGAKLLPLVSGDAAKALYGTAWTLKLVTIQSSFEANYTKDVANALTTTSKLPDGSVIKYAGSDSVYYIINGTKRLVTTDGFVANKLSDKFVISNVPTSMTYTDGASVTAKEDAIAGMATATTVVTTPGTLAVSAAASGPTSATLPLGATSVDVLKFNITAGANAVVIDEINVVRSGVGVNTGLTAYLYDGDNRLGSGKTFSSDTNTATFGALNYSLKAGDARTLTVKLKVGATAGTGNHAFSVGSVFLAPAGTVTGLPVTGNMFAVNSGVSSGSVTIDANGTLSNPTIGDVGATVAQFKLTAVDEDIDVSSITLKNDGTLSTDLLSNFALYQGSTKLSTVNSVGGRYVTVRLNTPLRILNGANKIFSLQADISSNSDTAKTIDFSLVDTNDIKAVGTAYGFGVSVTDSYDSLDQDVAVQGGSLTIANKSQSAHDVKVDSTEVELGKVAVTSKSDTVEVQKMTLRIVTTVSGNYGTFLDAGAANYNSGDVLLLRNIKLKDADTGRTLGSSKAITDCGVTTGVAESAALTCVYEDYFSISKGTTKNIIAVADINSAQTTGVIYKASFDFSTGNVTIKDSKDVAVTDIVPATAIASNNITTRTSALTLSLASTPETRTVVKGSTVDALGVIMAAGSGTGNDVKLSALTLTTYVKSDGDTTGTFVSAVDGTVDANEIVGDVNLYVDGVKIAGPASPDSTTGKVVFNSSKFVGGYYTIPAGSSKTLIVKAAVSNNAPFGGTDDAFAFAFIAADMTVEANGTTFDPTISTTNINSATPATPDVAIRITGNGVLTSSLANGKPTASVILAGLTGEQELSRINFNPTKEDYNIDKMTLVVDEAGSYDDIEYLQLYSVAGVALSSSTDGRLSGGKATFSGLNILAPKGVDTVVVVKAKIAAMGERTPNLTDGTVGVGADTGDGVTISLSSTAGEFHAMGVSSNEPDDTANALTGLQTMTVRKSMPKVSFEPLPSTNLTNATKVLLKIKVTADTAGDIVLKALTPTMTVTGCDITDDTVNLYDVTTGDTLLNVDQGAVHKSQQLLIDDAGLIIPAGTYKILEIRGTVNTASAGDSVETVLAKDDAALSGVTETATGAGTDDATVDAHSAFIWSDLSADTDAIGSIEYINGYLLPSWLNTNNPASLTFAS